MEADLVLWLARFFRSAGLHPSAQAATDRSKRRVGVAVHDVPVEDGFEVMSLADDDDSIKHTPSGRCRSGAVRGLFGRSFQGVALVSRTDSTRCHLGAIRR